MGYQSKTYSLSDEVVEAIEGAKAGGTSPNQFLRQLLGLESVIASSPQKKKVDPAPPAPVLSPTNEAEAPFHPKCAHCGEYFGTWNRNAALCIECKSVGHGGDPRGCEQCANNSPTGAL